MTIEKVSQEEMLAQFQERLQNIVSENQKLAAKIKENEVTAFKLQGAIETLQYYGAGGEEETMSNPPEEESEE
jgi:hypothetical protein